MAQTKQVKRRSGGGGGSGDDPRPSSTPRSGKQPSRNRVSTGGKSTPGSRVGGKGVVAGKRPRTQRKSHRGCLWMEDVLVTGSTFTFHRTWFLAIARSRLLMSMAVLTFCPVCSRRSYPSPSASSLQARHASSSRNSTVPAVDRPPPSQAALRSPRARNRPVFTSIQCRKGTTMAESGNPSTTRSLRGLSGAFVRGH